MLLIIRQAGKRCSTIASTHLRVSVMKAVLVPGLLARVGAPFAVQVGLE